jgi:hypothetical protein
VVLTHDDAPFVEAACDPAAGPKIRASFRLYAVALFAMHVGNNIPAPLFRGVPMTKGTTLR